MSLCLWPRLHYVHWEREVNNWTESRKCNTRRSSSRWQFFSLCCWSSVFSWVPHSFAIPSIPIPVFDLRWIVVGCSMGTNVLWSPSSLLFGCSMLFSLVIVCSFTSFAFDDVPDEREPWRPFSGKDQHRPARRRRRRRSQAARFLFLSFVGICLMREASFSLSQLGLPWRSFLERGDSFLRLIDARGRSVDCCVVVHLEISFESSSMVIRRRATHSSIVWLKHLFCAFFGISRVICSFARCRS